MESDSKKSLFAVTPMVSDHAVLQRGSPVVIRGKATPNGAVNVMVQSELKGAFTGSSRADGSGKWKLSLPALPEGGPYSFTFSSGDQFLAFKDIYLGDVYLLAGQSNMELPMERVKYRYPQDYRIGITLDSRACSERSPGQLGCESADGLSTVPVRQFLVPIEWDFKEERLELSGGEWISATPLDVRRFSAVGFFFAKTLYKTYHVPIGLILTAVGGTLIQSWLSREKLRDFPAELNLAERYADDVYVKNTLESDSERINQWWEELERLDRGVKAASPWRVITLDTPWNGIVELQNPGVIWFRKAVEIPPELAGKPARLSLGTIRDADVTYLNGVQVGNITYQYPPREYELSAGLPAGHNEITIRVAALHGRGCFTKGKKRCLLWNGTEMDLSDGWEYARGADMPPLAEPTFFERIPTGMYQAMIAPLHDFPLKGILWYQGESNADEGERYPSYFNRLIGLWREKWCIPELPVLFVQLPNYDLEDAVHWVAFREMQRTLTAIPHIAMVVSIDCGEENDLHPTWKMPIGQRLAYAAFQEVYGESGDWRSPLITDVEKGCESGTLILQFANAANGLVTTDGKAPGGFEIEWRKKLTGEVIFTPVTGRISENRVILPLTGLGANVARTIIAVRYAYSNTPKEANLCNKKGLPASPFYIKL